MNFHWYFSKSIKKNNRQKQCYASLNVVKTVLLSLGMVSLVLTSTIAQEGRIIDPDDFNQGYFVSLVLNEINNYRLSRQNEALKNHNILEKAAVDQAYYMASKEELTLTNKRKLKTTAKRVELYGGTSKVEELIAKANLKKGKMYFTYEQVATSVVKYWIGKKSFEPVLNNPKYIFVGLGSIIDYDGKKIYVSLVLGNYHSFNKGARKKESLAIPFTSRQYGLKQVEEKTCRRCRRFDDLDKFQQGLYVQDGKIFFQTDDFRTLKRLIRKKKDGIAVDIVQKEQYNCLRDENIVDYNLVNKGVLLKPFYMKKIFRKNQVEGKRPKKLLLLMGKLPEGIGDYELNFLVIQDKHVCKSLSQTYTEVNESKFFRPLQLVPDTVTIKTNTVYYPVPDTTLLNFRIPFEQNKSIYKTEDVEPLLNALEEPDFIIQEATVTAVSSIEGKKENNELLQQKRAESIINALKARQKSFIVSDVITDNSWELFRADVANTKYAKLADMDMDEAVKYIASKKLADDLEPILSKHRFAEVSMRVVYDIVGDKEQAFVVDKFNKTLTAGDIPFAFAIQRFIIDQAILDIYNSQVTDKMNVPQGRKYAPFIINKIYLDQLNNENKLLPEYCDKIQELFDYNSANNYIAFDKCCCDVQNKEFIKETDIRDMQQTLELFYKIDIPKDYIDNLNLAFQFKIIKTIDTLDEPSKLVLEAFERVKQLVNLKDINYQNSFELAKLFIKYNDYSFALKIMDAYLKDAKEDKDFIFTYIIACTHINGRIMTQNFVYALEQAEKLDKTRYCKLFEGDKFSFQVFDNPNVKELYCKSCME